MGLFDDVVGDVPKVYHLPREDKVDPDLRERFVSMAQDYFNATGEPLRATDTFRTSAEQADLFARKPNLAVPAGRSKHEIGMAIDIDQAQVPTLEKLGLLDTHGFIRPALSKGETWHIEPGQKTEVANLFSDILASPAQVAKFEDATKLAEQTAATVPTGGMFDDIVVGTNKPAELPTQVAPTNNMFGDIVGGAVKAPVETTGSTPTSTQTSEFTPGSVFDESVTPEVSPEEAQKNRDIAMKYVVNPILTALGVPHEYVVKPLVEKPLNWALEKLGLPETQATLAEAVIRPGEFGQVGGEKVEGTLETPLRSGIVTGVGALADVPVYGKLTWGVKKITDAYAAGTRVLPKEAKTIAKLWDDPALGDIAYQATIKTKVPSTIGPVGTTTDAVTLREGHALMSEQLAAGEAPKSWLGPGVSYKTNERIMSQLDGIAPGLGEEFYVKPKIAENIAYRQGKLVDDKVKSWATELGDEAGQNIGINLIASRQKGKQALKFSGVEQVPSLTPAERTVANDIQIGFNDYLERINDARVRSGLQPMKTDLDYFTFMRNFGELSANGINPVTATGRELEYLTNVPFKFAKEMKGGKASVELDAFKVFKNYAITAEKHINLAPQVAKIEAFITEPMKLADGTIVKPLIDTNPDMAAWLREYAKSISGSHTSAFGYAWRPVERAFAKVSENTVVALLSAYPRSVVNQTGALLAASAESNPVNLVKGLADLLSPNAWFEARKLSKVLGQRKMDVVFEELGKSAMLGGTAQLKHGLMLPLEVMDDIVATGVWRGAFRKAKALGLEGDEATNFADRVVIRTQGSASPIDRSNLQRTAFGRALTGLQTFTIADANYFASQVAGIGDKSITTGQKLVKGATLLGVGAAMNMFYRSVIGMPPPTPEPLYKYMDAKARGAGEIGALAEGGKELLTYAPGIGSLAYGRMPFGPAVGTVADTLMGNKSPLEGAASLAGVPGANLISRLFKTEEGLSARDKLEQLTGLPIGPRTKITSPPSTVKEALLGKEPLPKGIKPYAIEDYLRSKLK